MAKRFTDTDKWKKPFLRGLDGPYKLLWFYMVDDCDHAGIWQVDFEVARIRIGEQVSYDQALKMFGDRVEVISKFKWFLPDFITFQYGELKENNRMHQSVITILTKHQIGAYKPLPRGQGYGQGTIQGQGKGIGGVGDFEETWKVAFDEMTMEPLIMQFKNIDVANELMLFRLKCNNDKADYHQRDTAGLRQAFLYQLKNSKGANGQKKQAKGADLTNL